MKASIKFIEYAAITLLVVGSAALVIAFFVFFWKQGGVNTALQANTSLLSNLGSFLSGTVGITWSLASVIFFYLALQEQRSDVKTNQDALKQQIEEMKETKTIYLEQSDILKTQTFENTFYQLLQLYSNAVRDLSYSIGGYPQRTSNGKDVFTVWKQILDQFSKGSTPDSTQDQSGGWIEYPSIPFGSFEEITEALGTRYLQLYSEYENTLNHYFRQLYHILKYVHLSSLITDERRNFYTTLVRAQLSQNELYAIIYNSMLPGYGNPKFLFLIKQYNLVKNFNPDTIPDKIIWNFFNAELQSVSDPFVTIS
jgi:hypothetical protein